MPALNAQRFYAWVGMLLLGCTSTACDDGVVKLSLLPAAGGSPDASAGRGASGVAGVSGGGAGGDTRASTPRLPDPCGEQWETEPEDALRDALSDALDSGRYCPHTPPSQRRPLMADPELQWQARASICLPTMDRGWFRLSRSQVFVWMLVGTPNLEDAKKALLGAEHEKICEEAQTNPFRRVGVGHASDAWSVFIAPAFPEDMQKP